ncbi:HNH endonuclease [Rhizobium halophytocola]|uniref:Restriction endonuclease n=1 Tax=Rhizobium halophytocola TaxID=735519 RepID=A0ABS4DZT4_9HYPH|nr:HNH endonuclease [Rhizobium halophytocola]MBP1851193.1 putative restriction endonuclease [Rhizobium halophytocola]
MAKAVFYHKHDSSYHDVTGKHYHFPQSYLSRVQQTVGDWIVYYGPLPALPSRYYSGVARVTSVTRDHVTGDHYYAHLSDYLDFDRPLGYQESGGYERKLFKADGSVNGGRSVQAVRLIENGEFAAIITAGLSTPDEWPDRRDAPEALRHELDEVQRPFEFEGYERPIVSQMVNRPFRDAKFRQHIRRVYDRTCAFTGLKLINGGGRPEVEAAHIVPVEKGGNDSVQNGIALSGTVHWMFDRGLLSLADDYEILCSRHLNYDVSHILHRDLRARVPSDIHMRPHPEYMAWHRENIFKS